MTGLLTAVVLGTATIGELLPLPRVTGRPLPTSIAVVGTYALLGAPVWAVIAVAVTARATAALIARRRLPTAHSVMRAVVGGTTAAVATQLGLLLPGTDVPSSPVDIGSALLLTSAIVVGLPWWESLRHGDSPPSDRFARMLKHDWMTQVAVASTAVLGAVVHPVLGELAVPFVFLPLIAARAGLTRFLAVRRQHDQTIRAIGSLPEELGAVTSGHGDRTADLVAGAGRRLGIDGDQHRRLVHAARLHELGWIREEPGAVRSRREAAADGADILRHSGLSDVAAIVGDHRGGPTATEVSALLLRFACELDLAIARDGDPAAALAEVSEQAHGEVERRVLTAFAFAFAPATAGPP